MKQTLFILSFTLFLSPAAFADDDADSDPYVQAHLQNERATEDWKQEEARLAEVKAERERQLAAAEAAIPPEVRAKIIAEAKAAALEAMREEAREDERWREKEKADEWERNHPFGRMICQGDRDCMK